jgi:hypothetical protein
MAKEIREETQTLPDSLKPCAEHYVAKKLIFSPDKNGFIKLDPKLGLPTRNFMVNIVFWLAEAFGLEDREVSKKLALGLLYSSLAFGILDDVIEQETKSTSREVALANIYLHRYLKSFENLFEPDSIFWHYLASKIKEFTQLIFKDYTYKHEQKDINALDPLSEPFLLESCKSYSALVMTTLAALAYASNKEYIISQLNKFWNNYAMGHRIYDDLNDLRQDLTMKDYNNSSVLLFILQNAGNKSKLDEKLVWSVLMDAEFIENIYDTMLTLFKKAKEDAYAFNSIYLDTFMEELISLHKRKKESLLTAKLNFYKELAEVLKI